MTTNVIRAEIPLGVSGLTGSTNQSQTPPDALLIADTVSFDTGSIRKEGGAAKYNSTAIGAAPAILGGFDWWPTGAGGAQRMIVLADDGKLYKDSGLGTFPTTLASGLTVSDIVPVFVEGGKEDAASDRKLFVFTGSNAVQVLSADGSTTAGITTPAVDWSGTNQPTFGLNHLSRIWGGGNANQPHTLYYSTTTNHEDLTGTGSGSIQIYPGEGAALTGAISWRGIIVAFKKPSGIYLVDTTSSTVANWSVSRLNGTVGLPGPLALTEVDGDVLFVDTAGLFQFLSQVQTSTYGLNNLSHLHWFGQYVSQHIKLSRMWNVRAIFYAAKREAHFAMTGFNDSTNTRRIVVDFNLPGAPRFRTSSRDTAEALWLRKDSSIIPRPVCGDAAGFVWKLDQDTRSLDGSGYLGQFQTTHNAFGTFSGLAEPMLPTKRKNWKYLELVARSTGNFNLNIDQIVDGSLIKTLTANLGGSGFLLGTSLLGTGALTDPQVIVRRLRMIGSGRRISFRGYTTGATQDFEIQRMYVGFTLGSDRMPP